MKIYKLLHIPTGLYFTPSRYTNGHRNLSKTGKVYHNKPNPLSWMGVYPNKMEYNHPIKEYPYYEVRTTQMSDWKIIEGEI